jgi:hypothetical protein
MSDFTPDAPTSSVPDLTKRVRYSTGLVLGVDEFEQDQAYFTERDRLLTRALHGYGVVQGLPVDTAGDDGPDDPAEVTVGPGLAVAPSGQHVCVERAQCAVLPDWLARQDADALLGEDADQGEICVSIVLRYGTCETDFVPTPGEPCRSAEDARVASRLADDFSLVLEPEAHRPPQHEERAVRLLGTLLRALEVRPGGTTITPSDLGKIVKSVPAVLKDDLDPTLANLKTKAEESANGSDDNGGSGNGAPSPIEGIELPDDGEPLVRVAPGDETDALRAIETAWVTHARREVLTIGYDPSEDPLEAGTGPDGPCQPVPEGDDGVVLGTFCLQVERTEDRRENGNGSGSGNSNATSDGDSSGLQRRDPSTTPDVSTDERPHVLATRVLQEAGFFDRLRPNQDDGDGGGTEEPQDETLEGEKATGDVSGTYPGPLTVRRLQQRPIADLTQDAPGQDEVLAWRTGGEADTLKWRPASLSELGAITEPPPTNAQTDLVRVVATSWAHQRSYTLREGDALQGEAMSLVLDDQREDPDQSIQPPDVQGTLGGLGLAVAFGREGVDESTTLTLEEDGLVEAQTLTPEAFRVFVELNAGRFADLRPSGLNSRLRLTPYAVHPLIEVVVDEVDGDLQIVRGVVKDRPEAVRGAALVLPGIPDGLVAELVDGRFEVELRGDFILDAEGRAIDAEFVRGELPTGDRPAEDERSENVGVQGGRFDSWFQVDLTGETVVDLNVADLDQLTILPNVGSTIAERILEERERLALEGRSIQSPFDLTAVAGLTRARIQAWEGQVTPEVPSEPDSS